MGGTNCNKLQRKHLVTIFQLVNQLGNFEYGTHLK